MDYEQFKIKEFDCWSLYLHQNQYSYLGRCYASARREEANLVTEINIYEAIELTIKIIPSWYKAISRLYGASTPNVAIFGNEWPHLHTHLIPRFKDKKEYYGIEFVDPNPQGNYSPYPKREIQLEILLKIKEDIGKLL
ncbi:hypothetical protein J4437_05690 [Candidatus Woesearchaeota archaeon]|nr:hypothetical protein [Candidatus Woesearchaeota archaeon]